MTSSSSILWLESVDSTNSEARRRIASIDNLSVLATLNQTNGRGQRGNTWSSTPGENLTFSIVLKFEDGLTHSLQAYDQFAISQMASLSVLDFLSIHGIEAAIKWPNDIYVGNRKICGMLIENSIREQWLSTSIVGIGINVNQKIFPDNVPNPTSMAIETGSSFRLKPLLEEFLSIFESYRSRYLHINGGLGKLTHLYLSQMWRKDVESVFIDYTKIPGGHLSGPVGIINKENNPLPEASFTGIARGINDKGELVVEMKDSTIREFGFKEIAWVI